MEHNERRTEGRNKLVDLEILHRWESGEIEPGELAAHLQMWVDDGSLFRMHNSWAPYIACAMFRCGALKHPDPAYDPDALPRTAITPPEENLYIH